MLLVIARLKCVPFRQAAHKENQRHRDEPILISCQLPFTFQLFLLVFGLSLIANFCAPFPQAEEESIAVFFFFFVTVGLWMDPEQRKYSHCNYHRPSYFFLI